MSNKIPNLFFLVIVTVSIFLQVSHVICNEDVAKNYLVSAQLLNTSANGDKLFFPKPTPTLTTTTTTAMPCFCTCPPNTPPWTTITTTRTTTRTTTTTRRPNPPCNCGKGANPSATTRDALEDETRIIKDVTDDSRIVQGVLSAPNAWPWMAALKTISGLGSFCGATLINNWFVLTAAHCVQEIVANGTMKNYQIALGSNTINGADPNRAVYSIASIKMHPQWDTSLPAKMARNWDFALIRLATAVKFSKIIAPCCILTQTGAPFAGRNTVAAGWGLTSPGASGISNQLREVVLKVTDQSVCENFYGAGTIKSDQMCAIGTPATKGPCQGDSGGPLMTYQAATQSYLQIGVTSYGNNCQANGRPGVFGRISRVIKFIEQVTKGTSFCTKNVG